MGEVEHGSIADEPDSLTLDFEIGLPLLGRVVRYRGWLIPPEAAAQP